MLHPQVRAFLDQFAAAKRPPIDQIPLADIRAWYEEAFARLGGTPVEVGSVREVEATGPRGPIPIRVYTPDGEKTMRPLFVWYHGGGYVNGSPNSYDAVCRLLTRESGCVVASVDYRRAPEFPAPAPFEDCYAATEWLAAHAAELGADGTRLGIGGDSAGGGIAAAITLKARDTGGPRIAHQLLVYPNVGERTESASYRAYGEDHFLTRERMEFYYRAYIQSPEQAQSPYTYAYQAESLRGLPRATIVLAECDPLFDQGRLYAQRLREAGVPVDLRVYEGMIHAFFSFIAIFDEGRRAVTDAGRALGAALGAPAAAVSGA
ncbi:MAG TPA: alpha/beta hydrolase [Candidatus Elarobacter sp.]|jgi:acetyl esterase|nr:alpha/beta hydrolase [Candidatus Elarobacter sp.]